MGAGRIDTVMLGSFLRNQGHFCDEMMLLAIIRRIDADGDAMLTLDEFIEFLREEERPAPFNFAPIPEPRGLGNYEAR